MGQCPSRYRAGLSAGNTRVVGVSPAELRQRRLVKLSSPGDLDESWKACFLTCGLAATLKAWRSQTFPNGVVLFLLIEGGESALPSLKLQKFLWPVVAPGLLSTNPQGGEVLASRLQLSTGCSACTSEDDATFVLRLFGLKPDKVPLALFLWGTSPMHVVHLNEHTQPEAFRRVVRDMQTQAKKDWAEKGWDVDADMRGKIVEVKDLQLRSIVEDLHKKMAEDLLAAHSAAKAQDLVHRGVAKPRDFVVEDVGVSLDADEAAKVVRDFHLAEQEERKALHAAQQAELLESQQIDAEKQQNAARQLEMAERQAEEEEAQMVWAQMDRASRLEKLPPEASESDATALLLTVVLPVSGRRLLRRWNRTDNASMLAEFAFGSAEESEIPYLAGLPCLMYGYPRCALACSGNERLCESSLSARDVVYAVAYDN